MIACVTRVCTRLQLLEFNEELVESKWNQILTGIHGFFQCPNNKTTNSFELNLRSMLQLFSVRTNYANKQHSNWELNDTNRENRKNFAHEVSHRLFWQSSNRIVLQSLQTDYISEILSDGLTSQTTRFKWFQVTNGLILIKDWDKWQDIIAMIAGMPNLLSGAKIYWHRGTEAPPFLGSDHNKALQCFRGTFQGSCRVFEIKYL